LVGGCSIFLRRGCDGSTDGVEKWKSQNLKEGVVLRLVEGYVEAWRRSVVMRAWQMMMRRISLFGQLGL
jgi:hypothetical protein